MPITSDIAFTPTVKAIQSRMGSREACARMETGRGWKQAITADFADFIAAQDTFFLGTSNAAGQPYIQHRGGPKGFLRVVDDYTLAFGDFEGNRQYISVGNLADNDKAFIFLLDAANRRRIKIWGRARVIDASPEQLAAFETPGYGYSPTRIIRFSIDAWDVNCPQHITARYTQKELALRLPQMS